MRPFLLASSLLLLWACQPAPDHWVLHLPNVSSSSSPRPVDLNGDGVLDLVLGTGKDEFVATDTGIIAVDGRDGSLLWWAPARDQMVGSATFLPIDGDAIPDIVIGGRAGELQALSGKDGQRLWSYYEDAALDSLGDSTLLNFYIAQVVPDQNADGQPDLLVAQGGDATIPWYDSLRPVGYLRLLDSRTGAQLASAPMPDGKETFMSPLCVDLAGDGELSLLFGSGGEMYGGHFYRAPLAALRAGDLSEATVLARGDERGFIAPPVVVDLTHDGVLDIVVNAVDGRILAFDGQDNRPLWTVEVPGTEVYSSLAVGHFTGDSTPDLCTSFGVGIFPEIKHAIQLMVDGATGELRYRDTLGYLQIGSPLAVDTDGDGQDEALMSSNWALQGASNPYYSLYGVSNALLWLDFSTGVSREVLGPFKGVNPAATPWLGDLDGDQQLDLVYLWISDTVNYRPFSGMKLVRQETVTPLRGAPAWGSYMGTRFDGRFP
ncbi:MAG: hypothetical protein D6722_07075 [Bacteroidetes bacterium]|nr:MAG: hypothetical protein D6722_07075 [Bacteroidota bacterium]